MLSKVNSRKGLRLCRLPWPWDGFPASRFPRGQEARQHAASLPSSWGRGAERGTQEWPGPGGGGKGGLEGEEAASGGLEAAHSPASRLHCCCF